MTGFARGRLLLAGGWTTHGITAAILLFVGLSACTTVRARRDAGTPSTTSATISDAHQDLSAARS